MKLCDLIKGGKKMKILFVCTGNTCRSAMAEYIFKDHLKFLKQQHKYQVESAGLSVTGNDMNHMAKEALLEMEIKAVKHKPRQLDIRTVTDSDFVICMTAQHKEIIEQVVGQRAYILSMEDFGLEDIPDPYGGNYDTYKECSKALETMCEKLYDYILPIAEAQQAEETRHKKQKEEARAAKTEKAKNEKPAKPGKPAKPSKSSKEKAGQEDTGPEEQSLPEALQLFEMPEQPHAAQPAAPVLPDGKEEAPIGASDPKPQNVTEVPVLFDTEQGKTIDPEVAKSVDSTEEDNV